jgi:hypothetical protein
MGQRRSFGLEALHQRIDGNAQPLSLGGKAQFGVS